MVDWQQLSWSKTRCAPLVMSYNPNTVMLQRGMAGMSTVCLPTTASPSVPLLTSRWLLEPALLPAPSICHGATDAAATAGSTGSTGSRDAEQLMLSKPGFCPVMVLCYSSRASTWPGSSKCSSNAFASMPHSHGFYLSNCTDKRQTPLILL